MLKKISQWFMASRNNVFETAAVDRAWLPQQNRIKGEIQKQVIMISDEMLNEYLSLRETENLSPNWMRQIRYFLTAYLRFCDYKISKEHTIQYLNSIRSRFHQTSYRKRMLEIRKFLRNMDLDWMDKIRIVPMPSYSPKLVNNNNLEACLTYFKGHKYESQIRALLLLGASSGMRPSEIYRLNIEDFDLKDRSIRLHKTKTGIERTVYFNQQAKEALVTYCRNKPKRLKYLFNEVHCRRLFTQAPIEVKDLRKYFLQEWHRRGGSYPIGELLVGHSIQRNISLSHYIAFSDEEIKQEYDRIMNISK